MAKNTIIVKPSKGLTRTQNLLWNDLGSFFRLTNARLTYTGGAVEQTPAFSIATSWTAGTYYNGGVVAEAATSVGRLFIYDNATRYVFGLTARVDGVQKQVLVQSTIPAANTLLTNCLLVVNDYAALGITLGSTIDIEIEAGGATFKWRKNGGGYTTGLACSLTGTSIDGGNATVYFLAATGLNVGDVWSWTRTDFLNTSGGYGLLYNWPYAISGSDIYFVTNNGRVYVYQNGGVRSVGYRPVYGSTLIVYERHLYVGSYSETVATFKTNVVANSDLNNLDNFFPTDVNEADTYTVFPSSYAGNQKSGRGISGLTVRDGILYVYTVTRIYANTYVGLPVVNNYRELFIVGGSAATTTFTQPVVSPFGDYFLANNEIVRFSGGTPEVLSTPIRYISGDAGQIVGILWGAYDAFRQEVYFFIDSANLYGFLIYQERTGQWYHRAAQFPVVPRSMANDGSSVGLTAALSTIWDGSDGQTLAVFDTTNGTAYQIPTIETNDMLPAGLGVVGELGTVILDGYYGTPSEGSYAPTGIQVEVCARTYAGQTVSFSALVPTWTTAKPDGSMAYRAAARIFRFRIKPTVTATKASYGFIFHGLSCTFHVPEPEVVR